MPVLRSAKVIFGNWIYTSAHCSRLTQNESASLYSAKFWPTSGLTRIRAAELSAQLRLRTKRDENASEILGCTGIDPHSPGRKSALWRQHLLRGGACQRADVHIRLRHWIAQFGKEFEC